MADILVLDTETAGGAEQAVVQLGIVMLTDAGMSSPFSATFCLDPGIQLDPRAEAVHGLLQTKLAACSPALPTLTALASTIAAVWQRGGFVAGHGLVSFDLPTLVKNFARLQIPFYMPANPPVYDTGLAYKHLQLLRRDELQELEPFAPEYDSFKTIAGMRVAGLKWNLDLVSEVYGMSPRAGTHDAGDDARRSAQILLEQYRRGDMQWWELSRNMPAGAAGWPS